MANFMDEFRNSDIARQMGKKLGSYSGKPVTLMEVCGTHTMSIFRYGIRELLPTEIRLVSGPGGPVCVTPQYYIDAALELADRKDVIIATFGDMMRIPGKSTSLLYKKSEGRDIRIVYSPMDALKMAEENPGKKVVFLSVGFETTTPVIALTLTKAMQKNMSNFTVLAANKTMPEALIALTKDVDIGIDAYLYPGHVSAVIGTGLYEELAKKYRMSGVVTGFEPLDILHAILTLAENINKGIVFFENQYSRLVKREGNPIAIEKMFEVFEPCDAIWRGIGKINNSGLAVRKEYEMLDAWKRFDLSIKEEAEPKGCLCGEVLRGRKTPRDCGLFGNHCTPENPTGACMVSSEGTCAAYYKYGV